MSATSLLSLGASAMNAAQAQLSTTGHNIANASVEGYSRQSVKTATAPGLFNGGGYFGRGVQVEGIERTVNGFLTDQVAQTGSQAEADKMRATLLDRLQNTFGTGESGLGYAATQLFNAFGDVAAEPGDASARQVVLARADDLASSFRSTADQMSALQSGVSLDIKNSVAEVNNLAARIAELNGQLAGMRGRQEPNDLLDQRDQLIKQISQYVQVNRVEQDDGSLNLFIGGSQSLVVGAEAYKLSAKPDSSDNTLARVSIDIAGIERPLDSDTLVSGRIAGLLQFQDDDLAKAKDYLDTMAEGIATAVNDQQANGWSLRVDAAGAPVAGPALFVIGADGATGIHLTDGLSTDDIAASAQRASISSPRSNNENALALQKLGTAATVGGTTFTDYFSQVIADIGVRVQNAQTRADVSAGVATQAEQELGAVTGVSLDEEAARLIQFQQSYQAAAKVLQAAQRVFDTLLSIAG